MTEQAAIFEGRFAKPGEGFVALYQLAHSMPTLRKVFAMYKDAGLRSFSGYSLEADKSGQFVLVDRSSRKGFRNMTEHGAVATLAADSIGEYAGLSEDLRTEFNTEVGLHDVIKRIEVVAMGYRKIATSREAKPTGPEMEVLGQTLGIVGISKEQLNAIAKSLNDLPVMEFFRFVNEKLNRPFLERMFDKYQLPFPDRQRFVEVTSADSADLLPLLVARVGSLTQDLPGDKTLGELRDLMARFEKTNLLPQVPANLTDKLGALLWYADSVTKHNIFMTITARFVDTVKRGDYAEVDAWGKTRFGGPSYYDVNTLVNHAMEIWITDEGISRGLLPVGMNPEDLPKAIMERLQSRVSVKR